MNKIITIRKTTIGSEHNNLTQQTITNFKQLNDLINDIAAASERYNEEKHHSDHKTFKRNQWALLGGYADGVDKASIYNRHLFILDYDGKSGTPLRAGDFIEFAKNNSISMIIYTTASHSQTTPSYRVIFDIGKLIKKSDSEEYQKIYHWLRRKFFEQFGAEAVYCFDEHSMYWHQWMFLPCKYFHEKPKVWFVEGNSLSHDQDRWDDIQSTPFKTYSQASLVKRTNSLLPSGKADELYIKSVKNHLPKLELYQRTRNSFQWFRNSADNNAGLYSMNEMNVIIDNGRCINTLYRPNDFVEGLVKAKNNDTFTFQQLVSWEADDKQICAVFSENTGSGKSKHLVNLVGLSHGAHRVFTFPTKQLRDEFSERCLNKGIDNFHIILGSKDIVLQHSPIERHEDVEKLFRDTFSVEKKSKIGFRSIVTKLGFSSEIFNKIIMDYEINTSKMMDTSKHLIMTHAKLHTAVSYADFELFKHSVIYSDEYPNGCIVLEDEEYSGLDVIKIRSLKRLFVSAEYMTVLELEANDLSPKIIGTSIKRQLDENLVVLIVGSTSQRNDIRKNWFRKVSPVFGSNVIANGVGAPWNFTTCKGTNELSDSNICTIASFPNIGSELTLLKKRLKIEDDRHAYALWARAFIGQAIGRNMANRNKENNNYHLLIWPERLPFDLDVVTTNVYRESNWEAIRNVSIPLYSEINRILGLKDIPHEVGMLFNKTKNDYILLKKASNDLGMSSQAIAKAIKATPLYEVKAKKVLLEPGKRQSRKVIMKVA